MELFRVRLNCIDHYQSTPTKFDPLLRNDVKLSQLHKEPRIPVIRVFGATETGQKVCAHIHGAFPYLYIEYTGSLVPDAVSAYIHRLHFAIDLAVAVSYRRNIGGAYDGNAKYVARITLVKGIPFYGFHVGYHFYLKIYMLNPMHMTRLADLLRQGAVMKNVFQPYEAHLEYLLQWMADYNLYGCGYMDCQKVTFRSPLPMHTGLDNPSHLWHEQSVPRHLVTAASELPRVSHCSIEIDVCVQDILNRRDIHPRPLHHDFSERLNPPPPDQKLVHSMAGLWTDEARRRTSNMSDPDLGSSAFPPQVMISMSPEPRNSQTGGWLHEAEYREMITNLITEEKKKSDGVKVSFTTFVKPPPFSWAVKTSLESVEDLYPENLRLALGLTQGTSTNINCDGENVEEREVDEELLPGFNAGNHIDDDDFLCDSDEDIMREIELSQKKGGQAERAHLESYDLPQEQLEGNGGGHIEISPTGEKSLPHVDEQDEFGLDFSSQLFLELEAYRPGDKALDPSIERPKEGIDGIALKRPGSSNLNDDVSFKRQQISVDTLNLESLHRNPLPSNSIPPPDERGKKLVSILHQSNAKRPRSKSTLLTVNGYAAAAAAAAATPPSTNIILPSEGPEGTQQTPTQPPPTQPPPMQPPSSSTVEDPPEPSTVVSNVMKSMQVGFPNMGKFLIISELPPSQDIVESTMQDFQLPSVIYQNAFYGNEQDVPKRMREWAGRQFKLESLTVPFLPAFDPTGTSDACFGAKPPIIPDRFQEEMRYQHQRRNCSLRSWAVANPPPTYVEVEQWANEQDAAKTSDCTTQASTYRASYSEFPGNLSQIDGPTQKNRHGFKYSQKQPNTSVKHEVQYMSTMSLEIHVNTRGKLVPNPEEDEVQCLFWCLLSDEGNTESNVVRSTHLGVVVLSENGVAAHHIARQAAVEVQSEDSELDLMNRMAEIVRSYDPDILTGYEIHGASWGYLIERARLKYDYNLCDEFSRTRSPSQNKFGKEKDKWGLNNTSTVRVTGRHVINLWRAMRGELNLLQYTMENVVFHLLHRRIPHFTWADLTIWYTSDKPRDFAKVINHYISRVQLDLSLLERNELIARTSEQARLLGVDFFSVFSRGSQYKVESLMFRIAKPENFMLVSPSRNQVGGQNALECLPLVMEPRSAFYNSPLLVLDFQSLYPSVMIAYNYCYSTFLGRVVNWCGANKMGFTDFKRQQRLLELLEDHINIAPNGMMFVKPEIRRSLLAKMLGEILETRVMIKSGMKVDKDDKTLQRLLENRQLALKLIANVTYGYTSASFSGRMPCAEIADSIVQTGRETLEKAIALIHSVERWGAEVVYGDTDSIFIYLKGRTKDEAFDIGEEIAKTVTDMNPRPIRLKFEKVYLPCVLLAKKRYVGFKYESRDQKEPEFDAKGIETVRRDGTPAEQKIEEKALKILFRTADLSEVKRYFQRQCEKIMKGSVSIQDFCFAKEVKLGTYSDKGPPPPGAVISTKRMLVDARAEPQYGERVPYVVIAGAPGARLIDRCVAPEELLENDYIELDAEYYISKNIIPPLERIFNVVGVNVRNWYDEMPKYRRVLRVGLDHQLQGRSKQSGKSQKTLEYYMKSSSCLVCKKNFQRKGPLCPNCLQDKTRSLLSLRTKLNREERKYTDLQRICQGCSGISPLEEVRCDSKDCPVFYTRTRQKARLHTERAITEPVMKELLNSMEMVTLADLEW